MQEQVNPHKKWLVQRGDELGKLAKDNKDWKGQIRGIAEAARHENEPSALLNLVRYQAARNRNWHDPQDVARPLVEAMKECVDKAEERPEPAMALIRHLLAYTYRSFTFHEKKNGARP